MFQSKTVALSHLTVLSSLEARRASLSCLLSFFTTHALTSDSMRSSSCRHLSDPRSGSSSTKRSIVKGVRVGNDGSNGSNVVSKAVTSDCSLSISIGLDTVLKVCSHPLLKSIYPTVHASILLIQWILDLCDNPLL